MSNTTLEKSDVFDARSGIEFFILTLRNAGFVEHFAVDTHNCSLLEQSACREYSGGCSTQFSFLVTLDSFMDVWSSAVWSRMMKRAVQGGFSEGRLGRSGLGTRSQTNEIKGWIGPSSGDLDVKRVLVQASAAGRPSAAKKKSCFLLYLVLSFA